MCPQGARPELNTEIVIGETDYDSYAIMYYQKRGKITMKLYGWFLIHVTFVWYFTSKSQVIVLIILFDSGTTKKDQIVCLKQCICNDIIFCALYAGRSVDDLSEPMLSKFEQLAEKQNMGLAYLFPFPTYSTSMST